MPPKKNENCKSRWKVEKWNGIEIFSDNNKFVDGTTIVGGDLVKCCIHYWKFMLLSTMGQPYN
jgi:hypothetical protein